MPLELKNTPPYYNEVLQGAGEGKMKQYKATLTQVTSGAPTANVLLNTLGNIVWTRAAAGTYDATLTGAFLVDKVETYLGQYFGFSNIFRVSDNVLRLTTKNQAGAVADDQLFENAITINVYP